MSPLMLHQTWDPRATDLIEVIAPCHHCRGITKIRVSTFLLKQYRAGAHVQDVWPHVPADEREAMITGYHSECFDDIFKEDDDADTE